MRSLGHLNHPGIDVTLGEKKDSVCIPGGGPSMPIRKPKEGITISLCKREARAGRVDDALSGCDAVHGQVGVEEVHLGVDESNQLGGVAMRQ